MYTEYETNPNLDAKISLFGKIDKTPNDKRRKSKRQASLPNSTSKGNVANSPSTTSNQAQSSKSNPQYEIPAGAVELSELLGDEKLDFSFDDEDGDDDDYE